MRKGPPTQTQSDLRKNGCLSLPEWTRIEANGDDNNRLVKLDLKVKKNPLAVTF